MNGTTKTDEGAWVAEPTRYFIPCEEPPAWLREQATDVKPLEGGGAVYDYLAVNGQTFRVTLVDGPMEWYQEVTEDVWRVWVNDPGDEDEERNTATARYMNHKEYERRATFRRGPFGLPSVFDRTARIAYQASGGSYYPPDYYPDAN